MTTNQFLLELKKCRRNGMTFELRDNGHVRAGDQCPIQAVAHSLSGKHELWFDAAERLQLDPISAIAIMKAADGGFDDGELRAEILEACALGVKA